MSIVVSDEERDTLRHFVKETTPDARYRTNWPDEAINLLSQIVLRILDDQDRREGVK